MGCDLPILSNQVNPNPNKSNNQAVVGPSECDKLTVLFIKDAVADNVCIGQRSLVEFTIS